MDGSEWEYYSGYHEAHVLKYEVACTMSKPTRIVWVAGGFKGRATDITICRSSILQAILPGERILADKSYYGDSRILAPYKKYGRLSPAQREFNRSVKKFRQAIERVNKRLKDFNILKDVWRHPIELHRTVFIVCANITQLNLMYNPNDKQ